MLANLGVIDFWTYVVGTLFVILLPGPNSFFVLATSAQRGIRSGYQAASAVFLGDAVLMLLSALGVASLLKAEPLFFQILKYLGAAYLFYLGWGMLRGGLKSWRSPAQGQAEATIHDLAFTGFRAECAAMLAAGARISIDLPPFGPVPARVAWCRNGQVGGLFDAAVDIRRCALRPGEDPLVARIPRRS